MSSEKQPINSQPGTYQQGQMYPQVTQPMPSYQPEFGAPTGKLLIPLQGGSRDWSSGLCDCTQDATSCLMTLCCTPCVECQVASKMGETMCVPFCVPGAMIALRQKLRTVGGIQGTLCNDCLVFSFCGLCALCQMKREMDAMGIM